MLQETFSGDAIFIKLGLLEISAIGQVGIAAVCVLVVFYVGTRLFMNLRKG